MQHWSDLVHVGPWPRRRFCHSACSLVDPNLLSSSRCHHLHQESADKTHTWLPCPPPDLSVAEEEVVGLDPKLLVLWGCDYNRDPFINPFDDAWIFTVTTLEWEQVQDIVTKICCNPKMCVWLFRFDYPGVLVHHMSTLQ